MSASGGLSPARTIRQRPNAIIKPATSFGIMPAPGDDSVPNGRSPLTANTTTPTATKTPPATWSVRRITSDRPRVLARAGAVIPSTLPIGADGGLDALGVGVPEGLELGLVE